MGSNIHYQMEVVFLLRLGRSTIKSTLKVHDGFYSVPVLAAAERIPTASRGEEEKPGPGGPACYAERAQMQHLTPFWDSPGRHW